MALTDERKVMLLGLLRQTEMHGYLLNAHLDGSVPISLKKPTAYNLLDRMEQDGWVEHRDEPTGDRPRRVFSVTEEGERAFQRLLRQQLSDFTPAELPGLVSLSFLDAVPPAEALELLRARRSALVGHRAPFVESVADHDVEPTNPHAGSASLALEFTRRLFDLEIQFLDEVIGHLESTL